MIRDLVRVFVVALCSLSLTAQLRPASAQTRRSPSQAQPPAVRRGKPRHAPTTSIYETRAVRAFDTARQSPLELRAFLTRMPKGADLHMHLSGAVYAETFLEDARADLLCVDPRTLSLARNIGTSRSIPPQPVCGEGNVRADAAFGSGPDAQHLYNSLVDSFSMRSFVPSAGISAHDQFFATFGRISGISKSHQGEWLDEIASRAVAQNEQYLEIMETPPFPNVVRLAAEIDWPHAQPRPLSLETQDITGTTREELAELRDKLLAGGLRDDVARDRQDLAGILASRKSIERCGEPSASPACSVEIRFLFQVLRSNQPQLVFGQTLLAFEVAAAESATPHPIVVGLNFVQPEDDYLSMTEYTRQMRMLDYLHSVYPQVHISLHAGELAPGLVPTSGLRFHIRQAVDLGHAERIGHGVDIMYEDEPKALLKEMAERHVMVEINLTSNDVILGVSLNRHSLPAYRAAGVPTALSTDDEGVSRIDLTHEYARAATDFNLGYLDLKKMARTSIEHSFLPGASLWVSPDAFDRLNPACLGEPIGSNTPTPRCGDFLRSSQKGAQQWQLEHRIAVFESTLP